MCLCSFILLSPPDLSLDTRNSKEMEREEIKERKKAQAKEL
jgi:hypothetical protein